MSPVLGRPQRAPRSSPVAPGARALSRGRDHGDQKADQRTKSNWTCRGRAHEGRATRHTRSARRRPQPRRDIRCQATTTTSANTHHTKKAYGTRAGWVRGGTTADTEERKMPQYTTERTRRAKTRANTPGEHTNTTLGKDTSEQGARGHRQCILARILVNKHQGATDTAHTTHRACTTVFQRREATKTAHTTRQLLHTGDQAQRGQGHRKRKVPGASTGEQLPSGQGHRTHKKQARTPVNKRQVAMDTAYRIRPARTRVDKHQEATDTAHRTDCAHAPVNMPQVAMDIANAVNKRQWPQTSHIQPPRRAHW